MIRPTLLTAACLLLAIGIVHSWLGEVRLIAPLLGPEGRQGILRHKFSRGVLRFAWHITTLAWWGFAAVLVALAMSPVTDQGRVILTIIAATFFVTGFIVLVASRGRHLAWPVFLAIGALAIAPTV